MTLSVFDAARDAPGHTAVIAGDEHVSWTELADRTARRLTELAGAGALDPHGERPVAVVARPRLDSVTTLLALFAAGTPALLLHPRSPPGERDALVRRASAVAEPSGGAPGPLPELGAFQPERIAAVVPTSGSTGVPRLAKLSHRALLAAARASAANLGDEDDRWLVGLPLAHVGGLSILVRCLHHRATAVLFEPERSLLAELERFAAIATEHRITLTSLVPALLERLLALPASFRPPPSLRAVLLGGAAAPRALVRRARAAGVPVLPTYGLTEVAAQAVTARYGSRLDDVPEGPELYPAGFPLPGIEVRAPGGSIEIAGPTLFSGYVGEPESEPRGGFFATRDRGHFDATGELTITGRAGDVIITGGENVDPVEVEAALGALPGVQQAFVFGAPDATFGEVVQAVLVLAPGAPEVSALCEALAPRLARFKRPRHVSVVPSLPLTASGKLDRKAAKSLYGTRR